MTELAQEELRRILDYDPMTGKFTWRINVGPMKIGAAAGTLHHRGYTRIRIRGRFYAAHRLAWLHAYGTWPVNQLDHKNLNKSDNAIENLRPATASENQLNTKVKRNNSSGFKGVRRQGTKWRAQIRLNGTNSHLGLFPSPEEAHAAYAIAATRIYGEFARLS